MTLAVIPTTYRFDVTALVTVPQTVLVPVLDPEGNPVVDELGTTLMTTEIVFNDGEPVMISEERDLVFLIRREGITADEAREAFDLHTGSQYGNAIQSQYLPTEEELAEHWAQGLATIIEV